MTTDPAEEEFTRRFQHFHGYRSEARQADLLTVFKSGAQWAESQRTARDATPSRDHSVKVNIARNDDGEPMSWDVAVCGCDRPWRHADLA